MRLRYVAALMVLTASAVISTASTASASPFLYGTQQGNRIFTFDLATDTIVFSFLTPSGVTPDSLVVDSLGRIIYTSDQNPGSVRRVNPNGTGDVELASGLTVPKDLVIEPDGLHALVSESGNFGAAGHTIARIELCAVPPCAPVTRLDSDPLGGPNDPYSSINGDGPHGLTFDGSRLFANIGDRFGGNSDSRLAELNPVTGNILANQSTILVPNRSLDGLTFDFLYDNKLYATSAGLGVIYQFDPTVPLSTTGNLPFFTVAGSNVGLDGLTFDERGNLYIAAFGLNSLQRCAIVTNVGFDGNNLLGGTCTSLATVTGIDDLAPFFQVNPPQADVPEPASLVLLGTGLFALTRYRRRRAQ